MQQINVRSETPSSIIKMKKCFNDPNNTIVAAILADWCGACQQFKPIWESTTKKYISTLTEHQKKKKLIIATIQDTTIQELDINDIQGFPTIRLIKDRKVMNESLGGMSEERLMEFLKNAHKQCIVISPKKEKKKMKKQKRNTTAKKQKRNKITKKHNKQQNQKGGMLSVMAYYNPNYKKIKKNKKNKSLARKFKIRSSYSQKKRKTKRFRPKLKIIDESKSMSGGGKYLKTKTIKKTGKIKNKKKKKKKNKKGGYDSSISRAQAMEMQRQRQQRIREEQQRAERIRRLREQSREQRRKRVISDANRLFPERSYIYPDDYTRAQQDIEDHQLHERIMRTSVLPRATEVPVAITPSRNMFSRYIGTPLSRMFNRTRRRRRGRIQPDVVSAIPIASTVYDGNYLDDI